MTTIDYKTVYREVYHASPATPALVHVPPMRFLMLDGRGSTGLQEGVAALGSLARTLKKNIRKGPIGLDFTLMPLERLWMERKRRSGCDRSTLPWTLMIMQPPVVDAVQVDIAREELARKKGALLCEIRLASFDEGRALQILHVGPLTAKCTMSDRLRRFAAEKGLSMAGRPHEIYLSDLRKSAPERWKTILRQPVL